MQKKWMIGIPILIMMLGLCVLMVLAVRTTLSSINWNNIRFSAGFDTVSAEVIDQKAVEVTGPVQLTVKNTTGSVKLKEGEDGKVLIEARKVGWGTDNAAARAQAEALSYNLNQTGNSIEISLPVREMVFVLGVDRTNQIDFTITVPKETGVILSTDNGDIALQDLSGNADLRSEFGDISVYNQKGGPLYVETSNGTVKVEKVDLGGYPLEVKTDFGSISLSEAKAGKAKLNTSNGKVTLEGGTFSDKVIISSEFGDLSVSDSSTADLSLDTSNGDIRVKKTKVDGILMTRSEFGGITLEEASAQKYDLKTNNGKTSAKGVSGPVKVRSEFGDILVTSSGASVLDISTSNGDLEYQGSLGSGNHTLSSDQGSIKLTLPSESAFNFDLKTDTGKIETDFEVTLSGSQSKDHWVGKVNGGGSSLKIKTDLGNIHILKIK